MMGGIMDGIAKALTFGLHIDNGIPLEGSWDHTYYTRQCNVPFDLKIIVMPPTTGKPGGAGELGVAPSMGRRCLRVRPGDHNASDSLPDQSQPSSGLYPAAYRPATARRTYRRPLDGLLVPSITSRRGETIG
jgi:hypothetical protein